MANILNMSYESRSRIYHGKDDDVELITADDLLDNSQGGMSNENEAAFQDLSKAAINVLHKKVAKPHWKTKNQSFIRLYYDLKRMGIENNKFFLALYDQELATIDPYSPILPVDLQLRIFLECMINPWYYLREICRVPEDGAPIEIGGGTQYSIDRNNLACWYLYLNGIDHYQSKPRQRGKTVDCIARCNYAYHFGALSTSLLFFNKDQQMAKLNLYRLKCQRDMLPKWMQMRTIMLDDGKIDKGIDNITAMKNPVTNNMITVMPKATSKDSAVKLGRGATAAIQYYDEFDFIPWNMEIINAASFAYSRASENAAKNRSLYGRIFSSTPGDLDNKDGEAATKYIDKMLKWDDHYLDMPINQLKAQVTAPGRNRVVFVEHNWKQLKCSQKWYEDQCGLVSFNQEIILREIELQRIHGSNQSPFKRSDIMYLINNKREPIEKIDLSNNLSPFLIYEKLNRNIPYICAVDPSEGLSQDNSAVTFINPYTQMPAVEFKSSYISPPGMVKLLSDFMDRYCPKCLIVIENNRGREYINRFLESKYRYQLYYDDGKMASKPVDYKDDYGNLRQQSWERQAYGFGTYGNSRSLLFGLLDTLVEERKDILISQYVVDDICGLIRKANGRVEAGPGKHDDNIMSYLIGMYVLLNSKYEFLEQFGIRRGASAPENDYDENGQLTEEAKLRKMKELLPSLSPELQAIFQGVLTEKDPIKEANDNFAALERARALQSGSIPSTEPESLYGSQRRMGVTVDPTDQSFWSTFDAGIFDSNFERDYNVDIDDMLGDN